MKTRCLTFLLLILVCVAGHGASSTEALQQGLLEEEANQNLNAAIQAYQSVVKQFEHQRKIAATATFRLGECYRKLGKTNEARAQFERVLRDFADQGNVAQLSQKYLTDARGIGRGMAVGGTVPALDSEQIRLLREEITLVEQLVIEAEKRRQVGRSDPGEIIQIKRQLIPLQRKLPENADPAKQDALINQEIGMVQELLENMQKMVEAGRASSADQISLKRDLLGLQRELISVQNAAKSSFQTRLQSIVQRAGSGEGSSSFQNRLNTIVRRADSADGPGEEEAKEIQRIEDMIKNSPDLINDRKGLSGETLLHGAARAGRLRLAGFLLDNGAEVNAFSRSENASESTPLHVAAGTGHKAMVELLLARGAEVNATDRFGRTPLHLAAERGYQAVAQSLLAKGADVNAKDSSKETPLHLATRGAHKGMIEFLLANKADVNAQNNLGGTPLSYAVSSKRSELVELLIAQKADVNQKAKDGNTALTWSIVQGAGPITELLLKHGADPNVIARTDHNPTPAAPLHRAAETGDVRLIESLLKHGADVNIQDANGDSPLRRAVISGQIAAAKKLLTSGADPDIKNVNGETALFWAVAARNLDLIEELVLKEADISATDKAGRTPLLIALSQETRSDSEYEMQQKIVEFLLARGADPNQPGANGFTSLHVAGARGSSSTIIKMLLSKGAEVNAQDLFGNTPLHYAAYDGNSVAVELLLANAAKVDLKNREGATPTEMMIDSAYQTSRMLGVPVKTRGSGGQRGLPSHLMEIYKLLNQQSAAKGDER